MLLLKAMLEDISVYVKVFESEHHMVEAATGRGLRVCESEHSAWENFTKMDVPLQEIYSLKQKSYELLKMSDNAFREIFINRHGTLNSGVSVLVA